MAGEEPPEPWHSFLRELDQKLTVETRLHCLGGFVVTVCYGLARPTSDVDFLSSVHSNHVLTLGQEGTALHKKYGVYLQAVTEPTLPENYGIASSKCFRLHTQLATLCFRPLRSGALETRTRP
jgi:hypothetical protein